MSRTSGIAGFLHRRRTPEGASHPLRALFLLLLPVLGTGCSRAVEAPHLDEKEAAARAMAEYDKNHDGYLDVKELERCPGLKSVLVQFDKDRDGRLSQTEIEEGLSAMQEARVALQDTTCKVTLDGNPLVGATVSLEPESFMGPNIKPAKGTTDEQGRAGMQVEGAPVPGCNVGLYRVRISKTGNDGRETIPERYNVQTQLGLGVIPGARKGIDIFHLTSR